MCHSRWVSHYESWKDGVAAGGGLGFLLGTAIFIGVGVSIGECSANEEHDALHECMRVEHETHGTPWPKAADYCEGLGK